MKPRVSFPTVVRTGVFARTGGYTHDHFFPGANTLPICQLTASTTRPQKELKDFKRITLKPGESQDVVMTLTPEKIAFYGEEKFFAQQASTIEVYVGSDCTTTLKRSFDLVS